MPITTAPSRLLPVRSACASLKRSLPYIATTSLHKPIQKIQILKSHPILPTLKLFIFCQLNLKHAVYYIIFSDFVCLKSRIRNYTTDIMNASVVRRTSSTESLMDFQSLLRLPCSMQNKFLCFFRLSLLFCKYGCAHNILFRLSVLLLFS